MNIKIYTSPLCGYCHAAKRLLHRKSVEFVEIDLANDTRPSRGNGATRQRRTHSSTDFH